MVNSQSVTKVRSKTKDVTSLVCFCVDADWDRPSIASKELEIDYTKVKKWFKTAYNKKFIDKRDSYCFLTYRGEQLLRLVDLGVLRRWIDSGNKIVIPYVVNQDAFKELLQETKDSVDRLEIGCFILNDFQLESAGHEPKLLKNVGPYIDYKKLDLPTVRIIKYFKPKKAETQIFYGSINVFVPRKTAEHYEDAKGQAWIDGWEAIRKFSSFKKLSLAQPRRVREEEIGFADSIAKVARNEIGHFRYTKGKKYLKLDESQKAPKKVPEVETNDESWANNYSGNRPLAFTNIKNLATRNFFEELDRISFNQIMVSKNITGYSKEISLHRGAIANLKLSTDELRETIKELHNVLKELSKK